MRRIFAKIFIVIAILSFTGSVYAYDFMAGNLYYTITNQAEKLVEVSAGDVKYSGDVVIPNTVMNGGVTYTVSEIGWLVFKQSNGKHALWHTNFRAAHREAVVFRHIYSPTLSKSFLLAISSSRARDVSNADTLTHFSSATLSIAPFISGVTAKMIRSVFLPPRTNFLSSFAPMDCLSWPLDLHKSY